VREKFAEESEVARDVPRGFLESRASAAGRSPAQSDRSLQSITAELAVTRQQLADSPSDRSTSYKLTSGPEQGRSATGHRADSLAAEDEHRQTVSHQLQANVSGRC